MVDEQVKKFLQNGTVSSAVESIDYCVQHNALAVSSALCDYYCTVFPKNGEILRKCIEVYARTDKRKCGECIRELRARSTDSSLDDLYRECVEYTQDDYNYYNPEVVRTISKNLTKLNLVTLTMTSCKRLSLFKQTVNSFLNCCTDLFMIDRWVCVDDNSSEEDRAEAKRLYPFIEFINKGPNEKGHAESCNRILKLVETPYLFHLEDDWKFVEKRAYLTECLEVLQANEKYGQCLINRNYTETYKHELTVGGFPRVTESGMKYVIQEFCNTEESKAEFNRKYQSRPSCSYWPHFSLRPGLNRMSMFSEIGAFNPSASHFEMEYAYRYVSKGYSTVFLDGMFSLHIGRLTSERGDETKLNAYDLNSEKQFGAEPKRELVPPIVELTSTRDEHVPINAGELKVPTKQLKFMILVINMDRRADRWAKFNEVNASRIGTKLKYLRKPAVDGKALKSTPQLQRIFDGNDYNMRRGMVGCAMTHLKIYTELVKSQYDFLCVLEDDVELTPNFSEKFIKVITQAPKEWDIIYLGHHSYPKFRNEANYDRSNNDVKLEKWERTKSLQESLGGTIGYLISRSGAESLLEYINEHGMTNGIDTVQQKSADTLDVYYSSPHLVYSEYASSGGAPVDTDIQYDYDSLSQSIDSRFDEEIAYYADMDVFVIVSENQMKKMVQDPSLENVLFYKNLDSSKIREIRDLCLFPSYTLNDKVLVVVPKPTERMQHERYFDRLKKGTEWSVDDAIVV